MPFKWICLAAPLFLTSLASTLFAQPAEVPPPPPSYGEPPKAPPEASAAPAAAPAEPVPAPPPLATPERAYAPAPPDAEPLGVERHDGFYFRGALGGGFMAMNRSASGEIYGLQQEGDSSISGGGGVSELSIGGTPGNGLVIAGTLLLQQIPEPVLKREDDSEQELGGSLNFALIGASLDWYPNPTGGFHFGGTPGVAAAVAKTPEGSLFENLGGAGLGISLQIGYDWWISDEWSLGVLGRFTGAAVHGEAKESVNGAELTGEEDSTVSAVGVMFSVLYH